jgi:hypothetical protein
MDGETWREIPNFPEYRVSDHGRVWSDKSHKQLKPTASSTGHLSVWLYNGEVKRKRVWIHRAVLTAFVRERAPNETARHLDGNPANNNLDNLAWGTKKENAQDRIRHGNASTKLSPADIPEIRALKGNGETAAQVGRRYGVKASTIRNIWIGHSWKGI